MDLDSLTPAEIVAAHLALIVALVHLSRGMIEWVRWLRIGHLVPADLRIPLFVVSAVAIIVAMPFATSDRFRRSIYAGGIALMIVYVVGYFGWHALGHRMPLVGGTAADPHQLDLAFVIDHLFAGPIEFLTIVSEIGLAVLLAYLLIADPRAAQRAG